MKCAYLNKKYAALLLAFLLVISFSQAANVSGFINKTEEGQGGIKTGTPFYGTGILKDWQVLSFILAIITIFFVALARMLADPLNLPELKAWANMEWSQAFVTVIIVISAIGTIEFIDSYVQVQVNNSPGSPIKCTATDFCLFNVSNTYLDGLIDVAMENARGSFVNSIDAAKNAAKRSMISCNVLLPCFFAYSGWSSNAFQTLDVDRYNQEIEAYAGIIYSLKVQKFFINNINYNVGPVIFLIGIVARSFFLTRKIGGLLMATSMGIMFVFPMMYLWDMITLNVTVYGDKLFTGQDPECPKECGYMPANAEPFNDTNTEECDDTIYKNCPEECRELPYPYITPICSESETELACMDVPLTCKVVRNVTEGPADCNLTKCPSMCRIIPPLAGNHTCDTCFMNTTPGYADSIPFNCRIVFRNVSTGVINSSDRPKACLMEGTELYPNLFRNATLNCTYNDTDPYRNCVYILPFSDPMCENCTEVDHDYCLFKPAMIVNCAEECGTTEGNKPVLLTPAEFVKKSGEGMYGREDIKNVSKLLLTAYLLPLINIAVTLMFIRGFSPIFGGDIELPGYMKVL